MLALALFVAIPAYAAEMLPNGIEYQLISPASIVTKGATVLYDDEVSFPQLITKQLTSSRVFSSNGRYIVLAVDSLPKDTMPTVNIGFFRTDVSLSTDTVQWVKTEGNTAVVFDLIEQNKDKEGFVKISTDEPKSTAAGIKIYQTNTAPISTETEPTSEASTIPTTGTAYARTQNVWIDGTAYSYEMYALKDAENNETNYIKLRDLAVTLEVLSTRDDTDVHFNVGWNKSTGAVTITTHTRYMANGSESRTPYEDDQAYTVSTAPITVDGKVADIKGIVLTDAKGGGYTYFKVRDLCEALGLTVDWTAEKGVAITTVVS